MLTAEERDLFIEKWPKVCGCGEKISEDTWERLRYVGLQEGFEDIPNMELRNCGHCMSTLAVAVPNDFIKCI